MHTEADWYNVRLSTTQTPPPRLLLSGDEAVALAARDAGVRLGTGYPGTPSTEILEYFSKLGGKAQWAPNEKVALEVAIGAAYAGARALVTMKHVGLNVAADPLFTLAYTGVTGALIVVSADDPGMASSQNEQDNRHYAVAAGVPMLEPADSQEACPCCFVSPPGCATPRQWFGRGSTFRHRPHRTSCATSKAG
jgi:TPP-dependent indolepyruvate ferredoxin oxidoreductase alpha subunit